MTDTLFLGLSVVIALVTGWIAERMVAAGKLPANPNSVALPVGYRVRPAIRGVLVSLKPGGGNLTRLWREGLAGSRMILRWILFGFALTGLIRALVPGDVLHRGAQSAGDHALVEIGAGAAAADHPPGAGDRVADPDVRLSDPIKWSLSVG